MIQKKLRAVRSGGAACRRYGALNGILPQNRAQLRAIIRRGDRTLQKFSAACRERLRAAAVCQRQVHRLIVRMQPKLREAEKILVKRVKAVAKPQRHVRQKRLARDRPLPFCPVNLRQKRIYAVQQRLHIRGIRLNHNNCFFLREHQHKLPIGPIQAIPADAVAPKMIAIARCGIGVAPSARGIGMKRRRLLHIFLRNDALAAIEPAAEQHLAEFKQIVRADLQPRARLRSAAARCIHADILNAERRKNMTRHKIKQRHARNFAHDFTEHAAACRIINEVFSRLAVKGLPKKARHGMLRIFHLRHGALRLPPLHGKQIPHAHGKSARIRILRHLLRKNIAQARIER